MNLMMFSKNPALSSSKKQAAPINDNQKKKLALRIMEKHKVGGAPQPQLVDNHMSSIRSQSNIDFISSHFVDKKKKLGVKKQIQITAQQHALANEFWNGKEREKSLKRNQWSINDYQLFCAPHSVRQSPQRSKDNSLTREESLNIPPKMNQYEKKLKLNNLYFAS
eukprot:CAMPEP_0170553160 /NCGR_PEP_ID=MMETSP0211-20121228/10981_1 /TAXON_ID=311385 /ORGANISM="Pseudokeronopsis sp., Strain OXSARD2" /LENGTH=164 /DNA_ID=CAMNT_0010861301 /DNA_START=140 /DNA_END=634 /DNA_ORIENTATION=-